MTNFKDDLDFKIVGMSIIKGDIIKARFKISFNDIITIAGIKLCIKGGTPPFLLFPRESYESKKGVKKVDKICYLDEEVYTRLLEVIVNHYQLLLDPETELEIIENETEETKEVAY